MTELLQGKKIPSELIIIVTRWELNDFNQSALCIHSLNWNSKNECFRKENLYQQKKSLFIDLFIRKSAD